MIVSGFVVLGAGLAWLSFVRPEGNYAVDVLPASLVAALGMVLAFVPSLTTAISSARPEETAIALRPTALVVQEQVMAEAAA